jgi:uncharacterized protein YdeI (YjbR/CyaY-like superfamily)
MMAETIIETLSFSSQESWREWLTQNHHQTPQGIWLKIGKKASGLTSVNYAEALDEALCFGWIDGQKKSLDDKEWLQKFTPRRKKSIWSKVNVGHIARLRNQEKMTPAGEAEVSAAIADGRWDAAYDSAKTAMLPDDFAHALNKNPTAATFFRNLKKAEQYAFLFRLQTTTKSETRQKKIVTFVEMLALEKSFHTPSKS